MGIAHNSNGKRNLFYNNGTKPLIITNTVHGCTVPTSQRAYCPSARGYICTICNEIGAFTKQ
jgi:hypothetical protein